MLDHGPRLGCSLNKLKLYENFFSEFFSGLPICLVVVANFSPASIPHTLLPKCQPSEIYDVGVAVLAYSVEEQSLSFYRGPLVTAIVSFTGEFQLASGLKLSESRWLRNSVGPVQYATAVDYSHCFAGVVPRHLLTTSKVLPHILFNFWQIPGLELLVVLPQELISSLVEVSSIVHLLGCALVLELNHSQNGLTDRFVELLLCETEALSSKLGRTHQSRNKSADMVVNLL